MHRLTHFHRWQRLGILMLFVLSLLSCASRISTPQTLKFIVVRHAEKQSIESAGANFDAKDPALTAQGAERAAALADAMRDVDLVAIYATPFMRTQATAAPVAAVSGLPIQSYEANQDAAQFVKTLRRKYQSGAVLIVGHSNTVPAMVQALCRCSRPMLSDSDYGDRFEILIDAGEKPVLQHLRF
jgi:broad specificity phosphatase PhoE